MNLTIEELKTLKRLIEIEILNRYEFWPTHKQSTLQSLYKKVVAELMKKLLTVAID